MSQTISLIFNIALLVFILFGVIFGLIRGFRKTLSRGIFLLLTTIILMFVAIPITKALINIPIETTIMDGEEVFLSGELTIKEIITAYTELYLGENFSTTNPEFVNVIASLPIVLINSIVYLILFWICKYLLLPLSYLFYRLLFAPRKPKETEGFSAHNSSDDSDLEPIKSSDELAPDFNSSGLFIKKDPEAESTKNNKSQKKEKNKVEKKQHKEKKEKIKYNKHRLLGGLVGAVVGLIVTFNTMIPIYGILTMLDSSKEYKFEHITSSDEPLTIDSATSGISTALLEGYENSVMKYVTKYTGLEAMELAGFDLITSTTVDGTKITLREDLDNILKTSQGIDYLVGLINGCSDKLTQEQLDTIILATRNVIEQSQKVKLIDALSDYILPIACNYILSNDIQFTENENINLLIKDTILALSENSDIDIMAEINTLLDIVDYVNNQKLLLCIVNNDWSDSFEVINHIDDDFGTNLVNKIFELKLINTTVPHILNIGLTFLDEVVDFGYEKNEVTAEQIKNTLSNITNNLVAVAKSLDENSSIYVSQESLIPLGKLLDSIKSGNIFNEETYKNLTDYAVKQIKQLTISLIPDDFKDVFNNRLLSNATIVENWQTEMTNIYNALNVLRDKENGILGNVVEDKDLRQGLDINLNMTESVLNNIGICLDKLENTILFGTSKSTTIEDDTNTYSTTTITHLLNSILNYIDDSIAENETMSDFAELIVTIQENLIKSNHEYYDGSKYWENELKAISPLVIEIYEMIQGNEFRIYEDFGETLDKAKTSVMFGDDTTLQLMSIAIDIVKDNILGENFEYNDGSLSEQTTNDTIYELLLSIKENLNSEEIKTSCKNQDFWKNEIKAYVALQTIANQADSIETIEDAYDIADELDIVYTSKTISKSAMSKTIASVIRQLKTESTSGVDGEINNIIESIATDLEKEDYFDDKELDNFWVIELGYIKELYCIQFTDIEDDTNTTIDESYSVIENLDTIGKTLDKVTNGYTTSGENNSSETIRASYFITHSMLRNIISTAIEDISDSMLNNFEEGIIQDSIATALSSIKNNFEDTTNIPLISFEKELNNLKSLANIEISESIFESSSNSSTLTSLGETLDNIAFNTNSETTYSDSNSLIITRNIINEMIVDLIEVAKPEDSADVLNDTIDNISSEIQTINSNDSIISWEREFGFVNNLMNLKKFTTLTSITSENFYEIGTTLDGIAFNRNADNSYDETNNSLIITRANLNSTMAQLILQAKIEDNTAINNTIDNLSTQITTSSALIFSWERELDFVDKLIDLNETSITALDTDEDKGKLLLLGANLDALAFNLTSDESAYDDCQYDSEYNVTYIGENSVIVTREILKSTVGDFLETTKVEDAEIVSADGITNDLIDNVSKTINTSNVISSDKYTTFTLSFTDLIGVKDTITTSIEDANNKSIDTIDASAIDTMLYGIQIKLICGNIPTRKVAIIMLTEVNETMIGQYAQFGSTEAGIYITNAVTYYSSRISVDESEYYLTAENIDADKFPNLFTTLQSVV